MKRTPRNESQADKDQSIRLRTMKNSYRQRRRRCHSSMERLENKLLKNVLSRDVKTKNTSSA
jgi:hypothetical protein